MGSSTFALLAALSWSFSHVLVRLGSRTVAPLVGVVLSLASSTALLILALTIRGDLHPDLRAVSLFALAGVFGPCIGRMLSVTGIARLGATRASPLQSASQPIFTVLLGILILSEVISGLRLMGIALTLTGVVIVVVDNQPRSPVLRSDGPAPQDVVPQPARASLRALLWPLAAGSAFAVADLVRKTGMQSLDDALLGGAIGVLVAMSIWGSVLAARGRLPTLWRHIRSADSLWFLAAGAASGAAQVLVLSALRDGDLSQVGPIIAIQPILVAIIARTFINRIERVGLAVAAAAILATLGTILISQ